MNWKEGAASGVGKARARLIRRLHDRRGRTREDLALAEGARVVLEALASPLEVEWVLVGSDCATRPATGERVLKECRRLGIEVQLAPDAEVRALSATVTPQAILACIRAPRPEPQPLDRGRYLWPVGVRVPGNLGTLIRSAWCFGLDGVLIGSGTVDPWNPKAVRASAGGVFHLPLIEAPTGLREIPNNLRLFLADPGGEAVDTILMDDAAKDPAEDSWVLAVGGETGGFPARIARRAHAIALTQVAGADSLNAAVAGSILLYLLTRHPLR